MKKTKLCIITGGPSAERGISLNSARSLYDHIDKERFDVTLLYINPHFEWFHIPAKQIYSNTPLDFDYHLKQQGGLPEDERKALIQEQDIVFPAIHGLFGEDGQLQELLESLGVTYTGSGVDACKNTSDKMLCQKLLADCGFTTLGNSFCLKKGETLPKLTEGKWVVKPLHGGSSIGVYIFDGALDVEKNISSCFDQEDEVIIEPFCTGQEFTILVLENDNHDAVSLLPTQVEFATDTFFDYRKKYLSSTDTLYSTPARWDVSVIQDIRQQAQKVFHAFGMKDFARLDGRVLPDGRIWFSDINAISGMEQNSFLFQQTSLLGRTHRQTIEYIIEKKLVQHRDNDQKREAIPVVFGGNTAERQVSVLSGTNVLMKLQHSQIYNPLPFVLTTTNVLYHIPFSMCLLHSVEEIETKIALWQNTEYFQQLLTYQQALCQQLHVDVHLGQGNLFVPQATSWEELAKKYSFIFLGLHGGDGENGMIQALLDSLGIKYNGPGAEASRVCADKVATKKIIDDAAVPHVRTARYLVVDIYDDLSKVREKIIEHVPSTAWILKPIDDGCSAGIFKFSSYEQFQKILGYYRDGAPCIPAQAIHPNHGIISLPTQKVNKLLVEEFVETDIVDLQNLDIQWSVVSGYIEVTVSVMGLKDHIHALNPSQTIASQQVLSLEEKFMGGTGVNLTPPPQPYVTLQAIQQAKESIEKVSHVLGLACYSRIDTFMHTQTGDLIVIEVNTLPGMTPSTVFFHQGLQEEKMIYPLPLIEKIIELGKLS